MIKAKILILIVIIVVLQLTACGVVNNTYVKGYRHLDDEILEEEINQIIDDILELEMVDDIVFFAYYRDSRSTSIDLYGIYHIEDIFVIGQYLNNYLDNNPDSVILTDRVRLRIQCFSQEPTDDDRSQIWYYAGISNCNVVLNPQTSEWNDRFIFLDVNVADNIKTSSFNECSIPFVYIELPTKTVIDDFDVFRNMDSLETLVFDDPIYKDDQETSLKKQEEIDFYQESEKFNFQCYVY